jgi:hypothetical protein
MKQILTLITIGALSLTSSAQIMPEIYLIEKKQTTMVEQFIANALSADEKKGFTLLVDSKERIELEMNDSLQWDNTATKKDFLVVIFRNVATNELMTYNTVNINSIKVEDQVIDFSENLTKKYKIIPLEFLKDSRENLSILKVTITLTTNGNTSAYNRYFRFLNAGEAYGNIVKIGPVGLWFPVGMFGSNFQKTQDGIIFNALPVGMALGSKWNVGPKFYLGFSWTVNYTVTKVTNTSEEKYSFTSFSHGPLLDIGDWVTVGYSFPFNLTTDESINQKPILYFGVGVKVLDILKTKKS